MTSIVAVAVSFVGFLPPDIKVVDRGTGWWTERELPLCMNYNPTSALFTGFENGFPRNLTGLPNMVRGDATSDGWHCIAIFLEPNAGSDPVALLKFITRVQNMHYRVKTRIFIVYSTEKK